MTRQPKSAKAADNGRRLTKTIRFTDAQWAAIVDSAKASGLQPSVHVRRLVLGVLSEVTDETLGLPADKVAAYLPDQIIGHVVVKWLR